MVKTIVNKVGLEFEYFIKDKKGNVLIPPSTYGRDDFILLGEERVPPADNPAELIANFYKCWYQLTERVNKRGWEVFIDNGYVEIDNDLFKRVLKECGTKEVPQSKNLYGIDINDSSDTVIDKETGKILLRRVSNGLHIHFSSIVSDDQGIYEDVYDEINIPISTYLDSNNKLQHNTMLKLYQLVETHTKKIMSVVVSRITKPVLEKFVTILDEIFFDKYMDGINVPLKYRQKGFYELKEHGFEYRSLPFTQTIFNDINIIVTKAFELFDELNLE